MLLLDNSREPTGVYLQSADEQEHRHDPKDDCLGQNLFGCWRIQHVDCVLDSCREVMDK
jgi:hypothetical protein